MIRFMRDLQTVIEKDFENFPEKYPDNHDMQSAYINGIEDAIKILVSCQKG